MTKSFDEWFGEASQNKLFWESPSKASKMGFEAGQQSKQAEVDELQLKLSEDSRVLHNVIDIERKKCEELQKRIDGALKILDGMRHNGAYRAIDILKGNKDENY